MAVKMFLPLLLGLGGLFILVSSLSSEKDEEKKPSDTSKEPEPSPPPGKETESSTPPVMPPPVPIVDPAVVFDPYGVDHCVTKEVEALPHSREGVVKDIQWLLVKMGLLAAKTSTGKSSVDGLCGSMTHAAIAEYQKQRGLAILGYVDRNTYEDMDKFAPCVFQKNYLVLTRPVLWGRADLAAEVDLYAYVDLRSTPYGQVEALVRAVPAPLGSPCNPAGEGYAGIVTEVLEKNFSPLTIKNGYDLEVGDWVRYGIPALEEGTTVPKFKLMPWGT